MTHSSTIRRMIFSVIAIAFLFVSSVDLRAQNTYKRSALIEEVTGQWCGYCPLGAWYMDSLHKYLPDNAVIISWHNQDDMESQDSKNFHKNFGVSSWPGAFLNRYYLNGFGEVTDPGTGYAEVQFSPSFGLCQQAAAFAKKAAPLDFRLVNVTYSAANRTIDFDLDVTPVDIANLPSEDTAQYMVLAVFTEDGIQAYQHCYGLDGNANPSDIDPFTHNDVGRRSISNVAGDAITLGMKVPTTALPIRKHYSAPLGAVWNADKIKIKVAVFAAAPKNKTPKTDYVFDASMTKQYATAYPEQAPAAIWAVLPSATTTVNSGATTNIVWARGGSAGNNAKLEYTINGGSTWNPIIASTSQSPYSWTAPTVTAKTTAQIRVSDAGNGSLNGLSQSFNIIASKGSITIIAPAANEVIAGGTANYQIKYNGTNVTANKIVDFSSDGGYTWKPMSVQTQDQSTFLWTVPDVATTQAIIRITDDAQITASSAMFTITSKAGTINNLTLGGVVNNHIDNGTVMQISWTATGDIGSRVIVETSLDDKYSWYARDTVASTVTNSTWKTPSTKYFPSCFVRVVAADADKSTIGITSDPSFSIGTAAGVYTNAANGYSISNYPNPFGASTTIKFELPVRTFVTITIQDELGREIDKLVTGTLDAGAHVVPYNSSNISNGVYTYTLEAGATKLVGKMSVVK